MRGRLLADREVRSVNFNIETRDGVVYLLGFARSEGERENTSREREERETHKRFRFRFES